MSFHENVELMKTFWLGAVREGRAKWDHEFHFINDAMLCSFSLKLVNLEKYGRDGRIFYHSPLLSHELFIVC